MNQNNWRNGCGAYQTLIGLKASHCRKLMKIVVSDSASFFPTSLCGVFVFGSASRPPPPPPAPVASSRHTQLVLTHNLSTHNLSTHHFSSHHLSHHYLSTHNLSSHYLSTHNLSSRHLSTHNLSSRHLSSHYLSTHNFVHTQLVITPLVIRPLLITPLVITPLVFTQLVHTQLVITQLVIRPLVITPLSPTQLVITQLVVTLRGRRGTYGTGLALVARSVPTCPGGRRGFLRGRRGTWRHSSSFHVAGVVLGDIHLRFTWQAWHLATWIVTLRGMYGTGLALVARSVPTCPGGRRGFLRGRRGTWRHSSSFHVAGVVLGDIHLRFTWQAWRLAATWIVTLHGRRGTYGTGLALVARSVPTCPGGRRGFLRGRRGTWRHSSSFHVAGVVLGDIHLRFTWQAWHVATWIVSLRGRRGTYGTGLALVARSVPTCPGGRRGFLRGRRGTWRHSSSFHVAGVVLGDIHLRFTWQAWHLATWIVTLRGRRGTYGTGLALVARSVPTCPGGRRGFLRGRRGTWRHSSSFHVAGVVLGDIHLRFTWQAWHVATWIVSLRGRRGTYGTGLALVARLVPTCPGGRRGFLRGRRGTWRHSSSFHVAGVVHGDIHLRFTWQAWHVATWIVSLRGRRGTYGTGLALVARSVPTCPSGRRGCLRGRRGTWRHPSSFHVHTQLVHTQLLTRALPHTTYSTPILHHLFSLSCFPHAIFAACWKKLTCGVIRSFNCFSPEAEHLHQD